METFLVVLEDIGRRTSAFTYWTVTIFGWPFQAPSADRRFSDSVIDRQIDRHASQHPTRNACRLSRGSGLSSSRFARHY